MPDEIAFLRVSVTTALGALPLEGADVTVQTLPSGASPSVLLHHAVTDAGGLTPAFPLAAPARAQSLRPDTGDPYAVYTVSASRRGYVPLTALRVAVFSGVSAVLPMVLTPLPENEFSAPPARTATQTPETLSGREE